MSASMATLSRPVTIAAFKSGEILITRDKKAVFERGALPLVSVESEAEARELLEPRATWVGPNLYLNTSLDRPAFVDIDELIAAGARLEAIYQEGRGDG